MIVVDDAIAHAEAALGELGRVTLLPATAIDGPTLARLGARALVIRSVTRVDDALLQAAPQLAFVGTATAGVDHLDLEALGRRGVTVASAAGCNALAVAEWLAAALLTVRARADLDPGIASAIWAGPVGVVGYGNVGRRVTALLRALGWEVLVCDPPLARSHGAGFDPAAVDFATLWRRCPIVSFHVPLNRDGPDRTVAMIDVDHPAPAGPKLIVNSSRGPVVREQALDRPDLAGFILDVWDGEPSLSPTRLSDPRLLLASPHVAGYSLEGKIDATAQMHRALAHSLGRSPWWSGAELLPKVRLAAAADLPGILHQVVDLPGDDARVRALAALPEPARSRAFEDLRRGYRLRREFRSCRPAENADPALSAILEKLGFLTEKR